MNVALILAGALDRIESAVATVGENLDELREELADARIRRGDDPRSDRFPTLLGDDVDDDSSDDADLDFDKELLDLDDDEYADTAHLTKPTREDWLHVSGGTTVAVEYRGGGQTAKGHWPRLNPILSRVFGRDVLAASFNLHAAMSLELPDPVVLRIDNYLWQLSPVVVNEKSVGVVARRADTAPSAFLEVFAPSHLATELGVSLGQSLVARLLPGMHLLRAA